MYVGEVVFVDQITDSQIARGQMADVPENVTAQDLDEPQSACRVETWPPTDVRPLAGPSTSKLVWVLPTLCSLRQDGISGTITSHGLHNHFKSRLKSGQISPFGNQVRSNKRIFAR